MHTFTNKAKIIWKLFESKFSNFLLKALSHENVFKNALEKFNAPAISHINYWDQHNSWKNLWKFWNAPLCRNKSGPSPLLNVAVYRQSSNTEACAKKLSQILANNIDNGGRGIGLRIYVRYCIGFKWLTKSMETIKLYKRSFSRCYCLCFYMSMVEFTSKNLHL